MKIHEIIKIELEKNGFNNADISKFISLSSPRTQSVQTASVGSTNTQLQQVTVNCSSSSTVAQVYYLRKIKKSMINKIFFICSLQ